MALFNHAVAARLHPGQCLFSVNRGHLNARSQSVSNPLGNYAFQASDSAKLVKFAAVTHGLPPSHFSTTSWRATCATVLLASMGETYLKMFGLILGHLPPVHQVCGWVHRRQRTLAFGPTPSSGLGPQDQYPPVLMCSIAPGCVADFANSNKQSGFVRLSNTKFAFCLCNTLQ